MIFRKYKPEDQHAVLALINAAVQADNSRQVSVRGFEAVMNSPEGRDQSALLFSREGELAGFIWWGASLAGIVNCEGWVHPDHRRKGYGTALLTAVEAHVRRWLPGGIIHAKSYDDIAGIEPLFFRKGYHVARRFFRMSTGLIGRTFSIPDVAGVTFRTFSREDLEPLVDADNDMFSTHWGSTYRSVTAWRQEMIETRHHDPKLWIIAWEGDTIAAECLCHASRDGGPKEGWVSALGVRAAYRGRGLGRAMLLMGMAALQQADYHTVSLHVDADNNTAVNLYRSVEMDVIRTRVHYSKAT